MTVPRAPLTVVHGIACPLVRDDIDTDALIPTVENTRTGTSGYGDALFAYQRYTDRADRRPDPDFILNRPPFDRTEVLLVGRNFGCGSSRESAVWALRDFGIRVVVAESFNDTFLRNCIANGLAPLTADRLAIDRCAEILHRRPTRVTVDLATGHLTIGHDAIEVHIDEFYRRLLLSGAAEADLLTGLADAIAHRRTILASAPPWTLRTTLVPPGS